MTINSNLIEKNKSLLAELDKLKQSEGESKSNLSDLELNLAKAYEEIELLKHCSNCEVFSNKILQLSEENTTLKDKNRISSSL